MGPAGDNGKKIHGISPVITTIILSATLLVILAIASFAAANLLELQVASADFEQAKTNMLLLDDVIQEVALRRKSGGYVEFNQRSGGINIITTMETLKITDQFDATLYESPPLVIFVYRGGSKVAGADSRLKGCDVRYVPYVFNITNRTDSISYLRIETGNGLQIKLDYNRVRVANSGLIIVNEKKVNVTEITFIRLITGTISGKGTETITVNVQNFDATTFAKEYPTNNLTINVKVGSNEDYLKLISSHEVEATIVLFTEIVIKISIE
ncbi:MAG: hypothetical protein QXV01_09340 [Candidatus Bathyarchaeia archaeon]